MNHTQRRRLKLLERLDRPEYFGYLLFKLQEQTNAQTNPQDSSEQEEIQQESTDDHIRRYWAEARRFKGGRKAKFKNR